MVAISMEHLFLARHCAEYFTGILSQNPYSNPIHTFNRYFQSLLWQIKTRWLLNSVNKADMIDLKNRSNELLKKRLVTIGNLWKEWSVQSCGCQHVWNRSEKGERIPEAVREHSVPRRKGAVCFKGGTGQGDEGRWEGVNDFIIDWPLGGDSGFCFDYEKESSEINLEVKGLDLIV